MTDLYRQAQDQYAGGGPSYYPGQTYVPFSDQTQRSMQATEMRAGGSPNEAGLNDYIRRTMGQPGVDPTLAARGADAFTSGIPGSMNMLTAGGNPYETDVYGRSGLANLAGTARGDYLNSNPYLDATFNAAARPVSENFTNTVIPGINAAFGAASRTGSGIQGEYLGDAAGQYGKSLSDLATNIYGGNYQSERDRQLSASGTLGGLYDAGRNRQVQAGGVAGNLGLGGINATTGLFDSISGDRARAAGMVPTASALDWANIDRLTGVGSAIERKGQMGIDDARARYEFDQNSPWANLQRYAGVIFGSPGGYGTTSQPLPQGSPGAGAIGGGLSGAAAGYQFSGGNPWGAAAGGLLGAYGGYQ
jgi:hypothetical protein